MSSTSAKQARFMAGCANNPKRMNGRCPPPGVAKEFHAADKTTGILKRKKKKPQKVRHRGKTFSFR